MQYRLIKAIKFQLSKLKKIDISQRTSGSPYLDTCVIIVVNQVLITEEAFTVFIALKNFATHIDQSN